MGIMNVYEKNLDLQPEKKKIWKSKEYFYIYLHLIDDLGMEFTVC